MTSNSKYSETLAQVIEAIAREAALDKAELPADWQERFEVGYAVEYTGTRTENWRIVSLKGKKTSKWFHASIYRMDSGRYELVTYIL